MDIIENCLVGLPILICGTINQKCQLLNPKNPVDIFPSREALENLHLGQLELIFDIFLKDRDINKTDKILVEKVKLEIHRKEGYIGCKEEDLDMRSLYVKMCLIKKSIACFIMNSPLFSFLVQNKFLEIQPANFEALCGIKSEIPCLHFENKQLKNINIEGYDITVTLYTIPSHYVDELVNDYILGSEVVTLIPSENLDGIHNEEDEAKWDMTLDSDGYHIVTQKEEANKTQVISDDSSKRLLGDQDYVVAEQGDLLVQVKKSPERKQKTEGEEILGNRENKENKEEIKTEKQILEAILLEAQNLKKFSDKYDWGKETAYDVLLKENKMYDRIKNV